MHDDALVNGEYHSVGVLMASQRGTFFADVKSRHQCGNRLEASWTVTEISSYAVKFWVIPSVFVKYQH